MRVKEAAGGSVKTFPEESKLTMKNPITRRNWLKLASVAALGWPTFANAKTDLRAAAKKNLKLAIFSGTYSQFPVEEAARRMKADGFHGVILEYAFADVQFNTHAPDWEALEKMKKALAKNDLKIAALYAYYNVVDPDVERRQRGEARMNFLISNWRRFGCPIVCTETGTLNEKSEWADSPENETEKGYLACRAAIEKLAHAAEKSGAVISIEAYWRNVIGSAVRAERLFHEVNSPALKLVMDPCNYFRKEELPQMDAVLDDMFGRVGKQIVIAHAKDVKAAANGTDLPAAGKGVLDYPLFLRLLAKLDREVFLAIEHLTFEDVPRARDYVLSQFEKI